MRYLDGEASKEERGRIRRRLSTCRSLQEDTVLFMTLRSEFRDLLPTLMLPQASIWEIVRERLPPRNGRR